MITTANPAADRDPTQYRRHIEALEECARRLEQADLDPSAALDLYRQAEGHYLAADSILRDVEAEVTRIQRERDSEGRGGT